MILVKKKRIVISGFFQVLHAGHIDYINAAAQLGNVIAIVNSDLQASLKDTPSVVTECNRAKVINNLKGIYRTIISIDKDDSVANTLELINPDIFFNSGDRNLSNINPKEKEVCDRLAIKIVYDNSPKIDSSSSIIKRIKST